jgi:hypothetical protein
MSIDIYFTNRSLTDCPHALCREQRRDVLAVHQWVEYADGRRRDERVVRLRAGSTPPAATGFSGRWPDTPTEAQYAVRLGGAEYDAEGQLVAEHNPRDFLGFAARVEFEDTARAARDTDLITAWTELQALPPPPGTRFANRADALCSQCLVKDLAWANCSPRLCSASGLAYLAAGLALAIDRGARQDAQPGTTSRYREAIAELLDFYEIQPHAPTPRLDRVRAERVLAEPLEEGEVPGMWPDEHPMANPLLEALVCRPAPITPDEAGFLLARLLMITHLLSQIVEEQEGQVKRVAYRALTLLGTYVRCLRITQRFGLEMVLVA